MKKILLIEDDHNMVNALTIRLKAKGYDVLAAFDALQGTYHAQNNTPDLFLLDISMPGGNGIMVAERLRASSKTQHLPIIFLTANQEPELEAQTLALGRVALLHKPCDFYHLLAHIKLALDGGTSSYRID